MFAGPLDKGFVKRPALFYRNEPRKSPAIFVVPDIATDLAFEGVFVRKWTTAFHLAPQVVG
jgi:hypothetical protein